MRAGWAVAFGLLLGLLPAVAASQPPQAPAPGFDAACPFRLAPLEDDAGDAAPDAGPGDAEADPPPAFAAAYDHVAPVGWSPPLLYRAIRGHCQWLLDEDGRALPVGEPARALTGVRPVPGDDGLLMLEFAWDDEHGGLGLPLPAARLLRVADGRARLSAMLDPHPRIADDARRLYPDGPSGSQSLPDFRLDRARAAQPLVVRLLDAGFAVLDTRTMRYLLPPIHDAIRGYRLADDPDAGPHLWAVVERAPSSAIRLYGAGGRALLPGLKIGAVQPSARGHLLALRVGAPAPPPAAAARSDDVTAAPGLAAIEDAIARRAREHAAAGSACLYLQASGRLLDAPPAVPEAGQPCPEPDHDGLLALTAEDGRTHLLRVAPDGDAPALRLGVSDVPGRLLAFQERHVDAERRVGLAVVAHGEDPRTTYSLHDFDGRRLHPQAFDGFLDVGCGHWRVHDAAAGAWLNVGIDGRLDPRLTVPFSC